MFVHIQGKWIIQPTVNADEKWLCHFSRNYISTDSYTLNFNVKRKNKSEKKVRFPELMKCLLIFLSDIKIVKYYDLNVIYFCILQCCVPIFPVFMADDLTIKNIIYYLREMCVCELTMFCNIFLCIKWDW